MKTKQEIQEIIRCFDLCSFSNTLDLTELCVQCPYWDKVDWDEYWKNDKLNAYADLTETCQRLLRNDVIEILKDYQSKVY